MLVCQALHGHLARCAACPCLSSSFLLLMLLCCNPVTVRIFACAEAAAVMWGAAGAVCGSE